MLVNIKKIIGKLLNTPLIIEEGTDGNWTYKKWSDGTLELDAKLTSTTNQYQTWANMYCHCTSVFSLPSKALPVNKDYTIYIDTNPSSSAFGFSAGTITTKTATGFQVYMLSSLATLTTTLYVHIIGKWMALDPDSQTMIAPTFSQEQMSKASIRALIEGSGHIYRENSNWTPSDLL